MAFDSLSGNKNSADVVVGLVSRVINGVCGIAFVDALRYSGNPSYGLVMKGCPEIVTGHEIGHMFGALHNIEISGQNEPRGGAFYGNLMDKADATPSGYATIMA